MPTPRLKHGRRSCRESGQGKPTFRNTTCGLHVRDKLSVFACGAVCFPEVTWPCAAPVRPGHGLHVRFRFVTSKLQLTQLPVSLGCVFY